jgi:hypothetical protein
VLVPLVLFVLLLLLLVLVPLVLGLLVLVLVLLVLLLLLCSWCWGLSSRTRFRRCQLAFAVKLSVFVGAGLKNISYKIQIIIEMIEQLKYDWWKSTRDEDLIK